MNTQPNSAPSKKLSSSQKTTKKDRKSGENNIKAGSK